MVIRFTLLAQWHKSYNHEGRVFDIVAFFIKFGNTESNQWGPTTQDSQEDE